MNHVKVGPLTVTLHRTVRVHPDDKSNLPPSLGHIEVYKVADYKEKCPESWDENAVFVALHEKEALWMSFRLDHASAPVAVLVGAGGVNALNGEKLGLKLEADNYLVHPPQPWLDGWKNKDGTVFQFVVTEYKKGEGLSVGEQLHGEECKTGGLGLAVFEAVDPSGLRTKIGLPQETFGNNPYNDAEYETCGGAVYSLCAAAEAPTKSLSSKPVRTRGAVPVRAAEMGVGKGGSIRQEVYKDPYGLETWKKEPTAAVAVYFVNAEDFSAITGLPMPPLPKAAEDYYGRWYDLKDKHLPAVEGTDKFTGLKNVFHTEEVKIPEGLQT
jgi:hypothetical protein